MVRRVARLRHVSVGSKADIPTVCPLCPRKRTSESCTVMSALGQFRKSVAHSITSSARAKASAVRREFRFLFFVADVPDADYLARCVLDRVITGHVRFAE